MIRKKLAQNREIKVYRRNLREPLVKEWREIWAGNKGQEEREECKRTEMQAKSREKCKRIMETGNEVGLDTLESEVQRTGVVRVGGGGKRTPKIQ